MTIKTNSSLFSALAKIGIDSQTDSQADRGRDVQLTGYVMMYNLNNFVESKRLYPLNWPLFATT